MAEAAESANLTVPAEMGEIDRVRVFLKERLRNVRISGDELFHLDLALFEILVNIVRHGYPHDAGEIRVELRIDSRTVRLEIRDHGIPFDPQAAPPPALDDILSGKKKGGLGIYLARTFTDEMTYRREGVENVLILRKTFNR
jgi:serine/threonine-protein kinase RsbW